MKGRNFTNAKVVKQVFYSAIIEGTLLLYMRERVNTNASFLFEYTFSFNLCRIPSFIYSWTLQDISIAHIIFARNSNIKVNLLSYSFVGYFFIVGSSRAACGMENLERIRYRLG